MNRLPFVCALFVAACYAPVLNMRAVGCYDVNASDWTTSKATEYGFSFPTRIELDSALAADPSGMRRGWPWNDNFGVSWDNTAPDWMLLPGDTIVGVPGGPAFHTLGLDSIRVVLASRSDRFLAWLAPTNDGYRGLAQRVDWKTGRRESVPLELRRTKCLEDRATAGTAPHCRRSGHRGLRLQ